jgi:hypothetical protein
MSMNLVSYSGFCAVVVIDSMVGECSSRCVSYAVRECYAVDADEGKNKKRIS